MDLLHETETGTHRSRAIDRCVANKLLWGYAQALRRAGVAPELCAR